MKKKGPGKPVRIIKVRLYLFDMFCGVQECSMFRDHLVHEHSEEASHFRV